MTDDEMSDEDLLRSVFAPADQPCAKLTGLESLMLAQVDGLTAERDQLRARVDERDKRIADLEAELEKGADDFVRLAEEACKSHYWRGRAEERAAVVADLARHPDLLWLATRYERGEHLTDPPPSPWSRKWSREQPSEPGEYWERVLGFGDRLIRLDERGEWWSVSPGSGKTSPAMNGEWARATPPK